MSAFVRNDGLPQTSYSKYTWHITNLMQVKRIFDTPEVNARIYKKKKKITQHFFHERSSLVFFFGRPQTSSYNFVPLSSCLAQQLPLEVTQSFVKNADGSYSHFRCPEPPPELESLEGCKSDRPQAIRPMELRTFLKVGE